MRGARQRLWGYQGKFEWRESYRVMVNVEDSVDNCYIFDYASPDITKSLPHETPDEPYLIIYVTYAMLLALLTRHLNWNNAAIGGHIEFFRVPEYYQPEVFALLPYFYI